MRHSEADAMSNSNEVPMIFDGRKFFVIQRCPARSTIVEAIKRHGGTLVAVDTKADTVIADHLRKDSPANSLSYTWIEACINQQELVDTTEHQAGREPGTARSVGAAQPRRNGRVEFSPADDIELWNWVQKYGPRSKGVLGAELYKQLEAKNSRHPWQSWHDRWRKYVSKHRPANCKTPEASPPPSPEPDEGHVQRGPQPTTNIPVLDVTRMAPSSVHHRYLEGQRQRLANSTEKEYDDFWMDMSWRHPEQTAEQWRMFYEADVLAKPDHVRDSRNRTIDSARDSAANNSVGIEKVRPVKENFTLRVIPEDILPDFSAGADAFSDEVAVARKRSHNEGTAFVSSRHRATDLPALNLSSKNELMIASLAERPTPTVNQPAPFVGAEDQRTTKRRKLSLHDEAVPSRAKFSNPLEKYPQMAFGLQNDKNMDENEDVKNSKMTTGSHKRKAMPANDSIIINLVDDVTNESDEGLYGEPQDSVNQWSSTKAQLRTNITTQESEGNDKDDKAGNTSKGLMEQHETIARPGFALQPLIVEADGASNSVEAYSQLLLVRNDGLALEHSEVAGAMYTNKATDEDDSGSNFVDKSDNLSDARSTACDSSSERDEAELDAIKDDLDHVIEAAYEENRRATRHRSSNSLNIESAVKHAPPAPFDNSRHSQAELSPIVLANTTAGTLKMQQNTIKAIEERWGEDWFSKVPESLLVIEGSSRPAALTRTVLQHISRIANSGIALESTMEKLQVLVDRRTDSKLELRSKSHSKDPVLRCLIPLDLETFWQHMGDQTLHTLVSTREEPRASYSVEDPVRGTSFPPSYQVEAGKDYEDGRVAQKALEGTDIRPCTSNRASDPAIVGLNPSMKPPVALVPSHTDMVFSTTDPGGDNMVIAEPAVSEEVEAEEQLAEIVVSAEAIANQLGDADSETDLTRQSRREHAQVNDDDVAETDQADMHDDIDPDEPEVIEFDPFDVDLTVPPPPPMFSSSAPAPSPSHHAKPANHPFRPYLTTQALDALDTQGPDLSMPSPRSSPPVAAPAHTRSRTPLGSAEESASAAIADPADIEAFIEGQLKLGHSEERVVYALERTSMNSALAQHVLDALASGAGLPRDVPGVWTEDEDAALRGDDSREMMRLERWHGREAYAYRMEVLEEWG